MAQKATEAEIELRVLEVTQLILDGATRAHICEYAIKKGGISAGQADRYIAHAKEKIQEECTSTREDAYYVTLARYEELYRKAVAADDLKTAAAILKDMRQILNLDTMTEEIEYRNSPIALVASVLADEQIRQMMQARSD